MDLHSIYMHRCLQLASLGAGNVAPNPLVGAVLVHNGTIIGEGWHKIYGEAHAEVNCIASVDEKYRHLIPASTLYVSLEPCSHFGKTPPCTNLILREGIRKVVVGCRDPFKEVNGTGIDILQNAHVEVITGVLERECIAINKRFFTFQLQNRPYIILKWAQSEDGLVAAKSGRTFISNPITNRQVHKWRSEEAAILVGTNTALLDDPQLTVRLWKGNNPVRLLIDKTLRLPAGLHLFDRTVKTIVFNLIKDERRENLWFYKLEEEGFLGKVLAAAYRLGLNSILVEGGVQLLQSFIDEGLWDEARIITNQSLRLGNGLKAPILTNSDFSNMVNYNDDKIEFVFNT